MFNDGIAGIQFEFLGFPVRVQASFLIVAVILGVGMHDAWMMLASGVLAFIAILGHELGHAIAARSFGFSPTIDIHGFGGTTRYLVVARKQAKRWKGVVISAAGPAAGFLMSWLLVHGTEIWPPTTPMAVMICQTFYFFTFVWSILNCLPLLPLDGGHMLAGVLHIDARPKAALIVAFTSVAGWIGLGLWALSSGSIWNTLICAQLLIPNFGLLRSSWFQIQGKAAAQKFRARAGVPLDGSRPVAAPPAPVAPANPNPAKESVIGAHAMRQQPDLASAFELLLTLPERAASSAGVLAELFFKAGDVPRALDVAREDYKQSSSPHSLHAVVTALLRLGRLEDALRVGTAGGVDDICDEGSRELLEAAVAAGMEGDPRVAPMRANPKFAMPAPSAAVSTPAQPATSVPEFGWPDKLPVLESKVRVAPGERSVLLLGSAELRLLSGAWVAVAESAGQGVISMITRSKKLAAGYSAMEVQGVACCRVSREETGVGRIEKLSEATA